MRRPYAVAPLPSPRVGRKRVLLSSWKVNEQDGATNLAHHVVRDTPEDDARDAGARVRPHDDEVELACARVPRDYLTCGARTLENAIVTKKAIRA
jgi:hypothetical protein